VANAAHARFYWRPDRRSKTIKHAVAMIFKDAGELDQSFEPLRGLSEITSCSARSAM
jgi:hypothetical protein